MLSAVCLVFYPVPLACGIFYLLHFLARREPFECCFSVWSTDHLYRKLFLSLGKFRSPVLSPNPLTQSLRAGGLGVLHFLCFLSGNIYVTIWDFSFHIFKSEDEASCDADTSQGMLMATRNGKKQRTDFLLKPLWGTQHCQHPGIRLWLPELGEKNFLPS